MLLLPGNAIVSRCFPCCCIQEHSDIRYFKVSWQEAAFYARNEQIHIIITTSVFPFYLSSWFNSPVIAHYYNLLFRAWLSNQDYSIYIFLAQVHLYKFKSIKLKDVGTNEGTVCVRCGVTKTPEDLLCIMRFYISKFFDEVYEPFVLQCETTFLCVHAHTDVHLQQSMFLSEYLWCGVIDDRGLIRFPSPSLSLDVTAHYKRLWTDWQLRDFGRRHLL